MRRGIAVFGVTMLTLVGVAAAAETFSVSVSPNTPKRHSTLSVSAKGPFTESGFPTSVKLILQKGFKTSAKSVKVLCKSKRVTSSAAKPCPKGSKVGGGKTSATVQGLGSETVRFTLYLGTRVHKGDIAAVILHQKLPVVNQDENVVGRMLTRSDGGKEILFAHLPTIPLSAQLNGLSLFAHAVNGKHSLVTNPSSCNRGHWKSTFSIRFSGGTETRRPAITCSP